MAVFSKSYLIDAYTSKSCKSREGLLLFTVVVPRQEQLVAMKYRLDDFDIGRVFKFIQQTMALILLGHEISILQRYILVRDDLDLLVVDGTAPIRGADSVDEVGQPVLLVSGCIISIELWGSCS